MEVPYKSNELNRAYAEGYFAGRADADKGLREALKAVMLRLERNELINRPKDPCNHYDQPAYDQGVAALAATEPAGAEP